VEEEVAGQDDEASRIENEGCEEDKDKEISSTDNDIEDYVDTFQKKHNLNEKVDRVRS